QEEEDEEEEGEEDIPAASIAEFADGCTLHGLNHVVPEEGCKLANCGTRRVLWTIAFLFSVFMFLFQIADRILYYLEYHHITMLDEQDMNLMVFPAVTFCNLNSFRKSRVTYTDLVFAGTMLGYQDGMDPGFQLAPDTSAPGQPFSLREFFDRTSHDLDGMLLECSYRGAECEPGFFTTEFTQIFILYYFVSG
uniref:Acid sensing ion channel subunit 1 n=1 Tax=Latimeria chalumnae TaxID=7897 RepID=H3AC82_LATCH